jgi:hypothetical protein
MTVIVAPDKLTGRRYAEKLGLPPFGKDIHIVTRETNLLGFDLKDVPVHFVVVGWQGPAAAARKERLRGDLLGPCRANAIRYVSL